AISEPEVDTISARKSAASGRVVRAPGITTAECIPGRTPNRGEAEHAPGRIRGHRAPPRSIGTEMPNLLQGKRLLITGVLTPQSIAFAAAEVAQREGAEVLLTSFGKAMGLTEKSARRLPTPVDVLELDVNDPAHVEAVAAELERRWGRLDGFLHAIAFAPQDALGGNFLTAPWESAQTAFRTSAFSLKALAQGFLPLMDQGEGGAIVSMDFDATVA